MAKQVVRVVKVGGSLFDTPQLSERITQWLESQSSATNIFVAGGGQLADSIRQLDQLHAIGEVPAHWLCVRAMGVTARLLVDMLPDAALIDSIDAARELIASRPSRISVFDPTPLMFGNEPTLPGTPLPAGWHVTSDSIAARVAEVLGARELVLLKSDLPDLTTLQQASAEKFVDGFFATIASKLPLVRCVNLRATNFAETTLS